MHVIISEEGDKVTDNVMEWLIAAGKSVTRLDYEKVISSLQIQFTAADVISVQIGGLNAEEITSLWHRRARLQFLSPSARQSPVINDLKEDEKKVNAFIEHYLQDTIDYTGSYIREADNNKPEDLAAAKKAGLLIPDTLVTNQKAALTAFCRQHKKVICKQLSAEFYFKSEEVSLTAAGTLLLSEADQERLPDTFAISLFQTYIPKEVEIRVYFFRDKFFPMAIFSQQDSQTQVDYRHYNVQRPNRNVPFRLPDDILERLKVFNRLQNYTTGSFDLILSTDGHYYFLELNPSSQFHWLSANCNYYIEKEIAACL